MFKNDKKDTDLNHFDEKEAIKGKEKHFTESDFKEKLFKNAKKIGVKISYYSLLLFYAFKSPRTPKKDKMTIAGALGYLIFPVDAIPDFIPVVGYSDDLAVIIYAIYRIIDSIDEQVKEQAHQRMIKLFGDNYNGDHGIDELTNMKR